MREDTVDHVVMLALAWTLMGGSWIVAGVHVSLYGWWPIVAVAIVPTMVGVFITVMEAIEIRGERRRRGK